MLLPTYLIMLITTASIAACVGAYALVQRNRKRKPAITTQTEPAPSNPGPASDSQI